MTRDAKASLVRARSMRSLSVLLLTSCGLASPSSEDPVAVTRAYLQLASAGECLRVWEMVSEATQLRLEALSKRQLRLAPAPSEDMSPHRLRCPSHAAGLKPSTAKLLSSSEDEALVEVTLASGTRFMIPGLFQSPYKETPVRLRLRREAKRWKMVLDVESVDRPGAEVSDIGDVQVTHYRAGDPNRERVEADVHIRLPIEALEEVVADLEAWPRLMPHVQEAKLLNEPGEGGDTRLQLRFFPLADQQPPDVIVLVKQYGHLKDDKLPWSTLQWRTERPLLLSGSFELRPYYDRFIVSYGHVIEPRQWPEGYAGRLLAPEHFAAVLNAVKREAESPPSAPPPGRTPAPAGPTRGESSR